MTTFSRVVGEVSAPSHDDGWRGSRRWKRRRKNTNKSWSKDNCHDW
jgi:hypothetical protein